MMPSWAPCPAEIPHLQALRTCVRAGFRFLHLRDDNGRIIAIHAERRSARGVVETITVRALTEAIASRTRASDYPAGHPLWQRMGTVADVIGELLELPPHGTSRAPMAALRTPALWRPGDPP